MLQLCHLGELSPTRYQAGEVVRNQSIKKEIFGRKTLMTDPNQVCKEGRNRAHRGVCYRQSKLKL